MYKWDRLVRNSKGIFLQQGKSSSCICFYSLHNCIIEEETKNVMFLCHVYLLQELFLHNFFIEREVARIVHLFQIHAHVIVSLVMILCAKLSFVYKVVATCK
jgi:hypothetical protein